MTNNPKLIRLQSLTSDFSFIFPFYQSIFSFDRRPLLSDNDIMLQSSLKYEGFFFSCTWLWYYALLCLWVTVETSKICPLKCLEMFQASLKTCCLVRRWIPPTRSSSLCFPPSLFVIMLSERFQYERGLMVRGILHQFSDSVWVEWGESVSTHLMIYLLLLFSLNYYSCFISRAPFLLLSND